MSADRHSAAYGLDLAADPPVCCRATARGGAKTVPWPPDGEALRELARGAAGLAVAAPAASTVVRRLVAPFASARKAARVWASLLDMDLPFPVEAAQCDFTPDGTEDGKACAMAAAVRRADLDAFLDEAAAHGAAPSCCDAEALALWDQHLCEAPPAGEGRCALLVHAAADHVTVVRGRGRRLEGVHVLRSAPSALPAERWRMRFRQLAAGVAGGGPVDVWWSGGGVGEGCGLRKALSGEPGLRHETHRGPETFLARALARRATEGCCAGLLPDECLPPAVAGRRRARTRAVHLGVIAVSLLAMALNAALRIRHDAERRSLERQLAEAASAIVRDVPTVPGQEVLQARRALADGAPVRETLREARMPSPRAGQAMELLSGLAERGVRFYRAAWTPAGIEIAGSAPSPRSVENLPGGWEPDVSVQPQPGGGGCVFRMKGEWPGEP